MFQLGTKYSEALDARYTDENGEQHPMVMGCYGIGVSRVLAAVAEEYHDEHGLAWPAALAPYAVHLIVVPGPRRRRDRGRSPKPSASTTSCSAQGIDVLYDDRDVSPGVKFADADLVGVPVQLVVGAKGVGRGVDRAQGARDGRARRARRCTSSAIPRVP